MTGILLLFGLFGSAIAAARWNGFSFRRIASCQIGVLMAGAVLGSPGLFLCCQGSGGSLGFMGGLLWFGVFLVGFAVGCVAGLLAVARRFAHGRIKGWDIVSPLIGFAVAAAVIYFAMQCFALWLTEHFTQMPHRLLAILAFLLLAALTAAATMVAGLAVVNRSPTIS